MEMQKKFPGPEQRELPEKQLSCRPKSKPSRQNRYSGVKSPWKVLELIDYLRRLTLRKIILRLLIRPKENVRNSSKTK